MTASPVVGESRSRWWGGHHSPGRVILIVGWIVPAIVATFGMIVVPSRLNPGLSLGGIILSQMATWLPWAGWSLLVMWVADRVPSSAGASPGRLRCTSCFASLWSRDRSSSSTG